MPNSSKIAFIFHGEAKAHSTATPLEYLGDDIRKMKTILTPLWNIKKEGFLERSFFSEESLSNYKAEELDVLFYFTGHGIDYQYGKSIEYSLMLSHNNKQNITIKELVEDLMTHLSPKTLTIVLDACYSGQAKIETDSNNDIQLLSSSNYTQESYESWGVGGGLFTHFFCQAIEGACGKDATGKITLGDIADNIREPLKNQSQNIVEKTINLGKLSNLTIAYNKEIWEIKKVLKNKYTLKVLKEQLLTFYPRRGSNHNKIRHTDNFNELISILLNEKKYLGCILKKLHFKSSLVDEYGDTNCEDLKRKASLENKIDKLIIKVDEDTEKNLTSSTISGYYGYTSGGYSPTKTLEKLDLRDERSLTEIPKYIDEVLIGKKARTIELQLILPDALLPLNYQTEEINSRFVLLKRLVHRLNNHHLLDVEDEIDYWEENSQLIKEMNDNQVVNHIDSRGCVALYNKHQEKSVCILSNEPLSSQTKEIYDWGVPIVFYPQHSYEMIEGLDLDNCLVANAKNKMSQFMSNEFINNRATHLIYDDYYDVDFLPKTDI